MHDHIDIWGINKIMKYDYYIDIADIKIHVKIPFKFKIKQESVNFISDKGNENILFEFIEINEPMDMSGKLVFQNIINIYQIDNTFIHEFYPQLGYSAYAWRIPIDEKHYEIRYLRGQEDYFEYSKNIINAISLERILNINDGFILHSSFIKWRERGIIFSGPSGIGKSTQANLWHSYENAEIINGDKVGIRKVDGKWMGYGLPFAGSSNIFKNKKAEISCIVILKQGIKNKLQQLSARDAFIKIYSETTIHKWDRNYQNRTIEQISDLVQNVPVYIYECLPNKDAVEYLKKIIGVDKR